MVGTVASDVSLLDRFTTIACEMSPLRDLFTKSIVANRALAAGTVIRPEHLAIKKPGTGLPPDRLPELLGRRLRRDVAADQLLSAEDIEGLTDS